MVVDGKPNTRTYVTLLKEGMKVETQYGVGTEANTNEKVEKVTIAQVDKSWKFIEGTEKTFNVDTICMAVGLSPMSQLTKMAGCTMVDKGGLVPQCDKYGQTSIDGLFAAGDVAGIEEAS